MKRAKDRLHRVIVIGATPSGIAAANKLGELGIPVTLVDQASDLHQKLSREEWRMDSGIPFSYAHRSGLMRIIRNPSINCVFPGEVSNIKHSSQGFTVKIKKLPQYVDPQRCIQCGRCIEACPVIMPDDEKPISNFGRIGLPGRPIIDKRMKPLCQSSCPLGVNAQGYMALAGAGRFAEALELVRRDNVLPGICGRVCTHPCEESCRRQEVDEPIAIRDVKRFLADYEIDHPTALPESIEKRPEKAAVVGSGPAGLAAAADLARLGFEVTIIEKQDKAGGLLRYGLGPHRLPREILDKELEYIQAMGVTIETGREVPMSEDLGGLGNEYDAVILTTGAWKDRKLGAKGEDCKNVDGCLEFLNSLYCGKIKSLDEKVAVIGDGNSAFDAARAARRLGADVTIVSWFAREEIPADEDEIKGAIEEGVAIVDKVRVVEFLSKDGRLSGLVCRPTKPGEPDENGVCWPVLEKDGEPIELVFDRTIVAIGQEGPFNGKNSPNFEITPYGFIKADESGASSLPGVWAAGDAVTGPSTVVQSMASGRTAARSVYEALTGQELPSLHCRPDTIDYCEVSDQIPHVHRALMPEMKAAQRMNSFAEVATGLSESQVLTEAKRCLQCGVCSECMACADACGQSIQAIRHTDQTVESTEQAGAIIIADPKMAPSVHGEDVIRAYGPPAARPSLYDMLTRGFASAARAMTFLAKTSQRPRGYRVPFSAPDPGFSPSVRLGVFVCRCDKSMGWSDKLDEHVQSLENAPDVVHVEVVDSACVPEGAAHIVRTIREKGVTRAVLASCVCCPLDFVCTACTDQRSRLKETLFKASGISRSMVETCNLRGEVLPLFKHGEDVVLDRFKGLLDRSMARARKLRPLPTPPRTYNFTTAVIGHSEAAVNSAQTLADSGLEVLMFGGPDKPLEKVLPHPNVHCFEGSSVRAISGSLGDFRVLAQSNDGTQALHVGVVILGQQSLRQVPYIHQEGMQNRAVICNMQKKGVPGIPFLLPGGTSVAGLFVTNPPGVNVSELIKGAAAAVLAATAMPRGPRQSKGYTAAVDPEKCRGCGSCVAVCPYQAIGFKQNEVGGWYALVDEALCKGCGNCVSVCPNNSADSPYRDQEYLEKMLEEVLQ